MLSVQNKLFKRKSIYSTFMKNIGHRVLQRPQFYLSVNLIYILPVYEDKQKKEYSISESIFRSLYECHFSEQ